MGFVSGLAIKAAEGRQAMTEVELMNAEYAAWSDTSEQLKELGFDGWDDPVLSWLHAAVVLWGERLVALRLPQTRDMRENALDEAIARRG